MKKEEKHDTDLQVKLQDAQVKQSKKHEDAQISKLEAKIAQLEQEKKEIEEIAKRSQYDYITLRMDFDGYQNQMQAAERTQQVDILIATVKKFLPFIEDLRKSLANITEEHINDPLTKGVQMIYDKFIKTLAQMHIKPIASMGLVPDSLLHEPVNVQPVDDEKMKGKIIQEFEGGFVYEHDGEKRVVAPAKVIVGG